MAFIFGYLAVLRDRSLAASEKIFARTTFRAFDPLLTQLLNTHVREIASANNLVNKVFETPLLKVGEVGDMLEFDDDAWNKELRTLELTPMDVDVPSEGSHYTRDLRKLLSGYEERVGTLNRALREFSLLSRVRTILEEPDSAALNPYRQRLLADHGVEDTRDLVVSEAFQAKAGDLRDVIERTANQVIKQNKVLHSRLATIREQVRDV